MQITGPIDDNALPSSPPDSSSLLRRMRRRHRVIHLKRTLGFWWYRVLLIVLMGLLAPFLGPVFLANPKIVLGGAAGLVVMFWVVRRIEFGLVFAAISATAIFPLALSVKSLNLYPPIIIIPVLFSAVLVRTAFHRHAPFLPSFRAIWPQLGLIALALVSTIMVQFTWTHSVPRKINSNPIVFDQILGIALFFFPLITIITVTMIVAWKERLIKSILNAYLIISLFGAAIIMFEFKRIGADLYTFRYSEPHIYWMNLRSLAQLLGLGAIIAYTRFLCATTWRQRFIYIAILVPCMVSMYLSLENSWWVELAVGILVITALYSPRLLLAIFIATLPLIPILKAELAKLSQAKTVDSLRFVIWQDALRVWSKQPLLGVGPGDFWAYDQRFTKLPLGLKNFNLTGLGVAHNGYLQVLAELGPLGLFFQLSMIAVIAYIAMQCYRRCKVRKKRGVTFTRLVGLELERESEKRDDRILALIVWGLVCGSAVADVFSGSFFLPARQVNSFTALPDSLTTWVVVGCLLYKHQLWRMTRKGSFVATEKMDAPKFVVRK
jgi:O-antigen ligase